MGAAGIVTSAPGFGVEAMAMSDEKPVSGTEWSWSGGYPDEADLLMAQPPAPPFDWVRESTSIWYYERNGEFAIPRIGIEAEPWSWEDRRVGGSMAFADGRALRYGSLGKMHPVLDENGQRTILGGGPLTFRCIEPFRKWHVIFDGEMIDTTVEEQIAGTVNPDKRVKVRYELELEMAAPADPQNISPGMFTRLGKGQQRDAVSIGLGWRFTQALRGLGELRIDGRTLPFEGSGIRVKRRSIRTDALMLRGHVWQSATFADGRAFGFEVRPVHEEGFEPWNEGYVYVDGKMRRARVENPRWLVAPVTKGEDISFDLRCEDGTVHHIKGTSLLNTFAIASTGMWGLTLHQGGGLYEWDGQKAIGMIERSRNTGLKAEFNERL